MKKEQPQSKPYDNVSRREFLKLFSYTLGTSMLLQSCEQSTRKAVPYLIQPEEIIPGESLHYSSSYCYNGEYSGLVVEVRNGKAIKLEGNNLCPISKGKLNARLQASLLNVYDPDRITQAMISGVKTPWEEFDNTVLKELTKLKNQEDKVLLLTSNAYSPSTQEVFNKFLEAYPNTELISYTTNSITAIPAANEHCFGIKKEPSYTLKDLKILVSFQADFLNTGIAPLEFCDMYTQVRNASSKQDYLLHYQIESTMSISGAAADKRISIHPHEEKLWLIDIYNFLKAKAIQDADKYTFRNLKIKEIASLLWKNKSKALIISATNSLEIQVLVNGINYILEAYNTHIDFSMSCTYNINDDQEIYDTLIKLKNGYYKGMICFEANPIYHFPEYSTDEAIRKLNFTLSIDCYLNETGALCTHFAASNYYLESWNDFQLRENFIALQQPVIKALHNTRSGQDSLIKWSGDSDTYLNLLRRSWKKRYYSEKQNLSHSFDNFWTDCVQRGILELHDSNPIEVEIKHEALNGFSAPIEFTRKLTLCAVESVAMGSGYLANNPWLYELPDPLTKICWDNYACISATLADHYKLIEGDVILVNDKWELPVVIMPGQNESTLTVALGYGREKNGRLSNNLGWNAFKLLGIKDGFWQNKMDCRIKKTSKNISLAKTQMHASEEGRNIVRSIALSEIESSPKAEPSYESMYPQTTHKTYHWGMAIDLNKCIGCSACVIACQAENNIPVVGKSEVQKNRIMHWIRIDRYFKENKDDVLVNFQPLNCQHCNQAPCENVCPVSATSNTSEGINQMIYNRCIGTRYCSNNCPYKVRRFNWRDYTKADALKNNSYDPANMTEGLMPLVLNPDVAVRAKGVIEKCSFCYQRIAEKKISSRKNKMELNDGAIQPACMQTCPTNAIVFGDMNNPQSELVGLLNNSRAYSLLEDLHTLPAVKYLAKITPLT